MSAPPLDRPPALQHCRGWSKSAFAPVCTRLHRQKYCLMASADRKLQVRSAEGSLVPARPGNPHPSLAPGCHGLFFAPKPSDHLSLLPMHALTPSMLTPDRARLFRSCTMVQSWWAGRRHGSIAYRTCSEVCVASASCFHARDLVRGLVHRLNITSVSQGSSSDDCGAAICAIWGS